jgi:hypothetical protein
LFQRQANLNFVALGLKRYPVCIKLIKVKTHVAIGKKAHRRNKKISRLEHGAFASKNAIKKFRTASNV